MPKLLFQRRQFLKGLGLGAAALPLLNVDLSRADVGAPPQEASCESASAPVGFVSIARS